MYWDIMKEKECGLNQERTCTKNQQGNIDYLRYQTILFL